MPQLRRIPYYLFIALLVYMPFHIFLSQSLSLLTGGLEVWKIAKDIVLAAGVLFTICLVFWKKQGSGGFWILTGLTALYGMLHLALWATHPHIYDKSAMIGLVFNLRVPAFALLGYGAYLLNPPASTTSRKFVFSSLIKIIIGVSTLVALLGLIQYVLPKDILTHVGYSLDRGVRPAFFVDDNPAFPRIMSTLREPNALGAYLLLPIGLLSGLLVRAQAARKRFGISLLLLVQATAMYLTASRSALIGLVCTVGLVLLWSARGRLKVYIKRYRWQLMVGLIGVVAGCFSLLVLARNEPHIAGLISHSTPDSGQTNDLDSNDYHWLFFKQGIEGIAAQPEGHGPGTAGLASIQNPSGSFLTENYFVQIGYEVGVFGLLLFLILSIWLYSRLRRKNDVLSRALLASFWGYIIMNMLLHTWSNEAVAAQWWLLAGLAVAAGHAENTKAKVQ